MALSPGDRLDRYELLCVLAQGGMGTVWLGRMTGKAGFERLVAVKTILPTFSTDRQFCDMFLDEARIASQIDHENVARILDIGEDRGLLYYAMELVDGQSLRKLYRDVRAAGAPFPMGVALRVAADACAGLHATHELRAIDGTPLDVVHRDVSPQNLLLTIRGTTKLIDFGVAKARARRSEETAAGTLKGKIEYMAPEQARADRLDRRADIYSVGAVLYELLAGRPVRDTDDGRQLAALHDLMVGAPHRPLPPTVPGVVRNVVERAIARDPALRFATADELRRALEEAMLASGLSATIDDVSALLAQYSGERAAKRKSAIDRAVRAAMDGRLNAATLVGPISSGQLPEVGSGDALGSAPVALPAAAPAAPRPLGDGPVTGPSMRSIDGASFTAWPAPRRSATKIVIGVVVLGLVASLGVAAGVVLSRRGQAPDAAAVEQAAPPEPVTSPPVEAVPIASPPSTGFEAAADEPAEDAGEAPAADDEHDAGPAPTARPVRKRRRVVRPKSPPKKPKTGSTSELTDDPYGF